MRRTTPDEVPPTQMHADVHIGGDFRDAVVVQVDVGVKEVVDGADVGGVFGEAGAEFGGAEI